MAEFPPVAVVYGEALSGVRKKAVEALSSAVLEYTRAYPVCVPYGKEPPEGALLMYIGTGENNPALSALPGEPVTDSQSYRIYVKNGTVYIEGGGDAGVLYGCVDFYNKYLTPLEFPHDDNLFVRNPFSLPFPDFDLRSSPAVQYRGLWSWGHVIYDYRAFFDNMTRLKLNCAVIWNDALPLNAREIADYAHSCGIRLLWGTSWCWDTDCARFSLENVLDNAAPLAESYERDYAGSGADGVYFQSFTELPQSSIGGYSIAESVTALVNRTAGLIFSRHPDARLQFGLHATSVRDQLGAIAGVDPRVRIVWEDCGSFPFSYTPSRLDDFDETMAFTERISALRGPGEKFGAVTKGFTKLDWSAFTHIPGSVNIGGASAAMQEERLRGLRRAWRYFQSYWITGAPYAAEAVRVMRRASGGDLYIMALVEDGLFEREIPFPVALYSEILWDASRSTDKTLNEVALRRNVTFA